MFKIGVLANLEGLIFYILEITDTWNLRVYLLTIDTEKAH